MPHLVETQQPCEADEAKSLVHRLGLPQFPDGVEG